MKPPSKTASLDDLQDYVKKIEIERGFENEDALSKCLLLGEEVGELFKAVRESIGLGVDVNSTSTGVAEELADILNFVFAIANRFNVDLSTAYIEKELKNAHREWGKRPQH